MTSDINNNYDSQYCLNGDMNKNFMWLRCPLWICVPHWPPKWEC